MKHFLVLFIFLVIFSIAPLIEDSEARKASGTSTRSYGSETRDLVCGDRLCSDVERGYPPLKSSIPEVSQQDSSEEITLPETVSITCQENPARYFVSDQSLLTPETFALSRLNVPATIPLHQGYYDGKFVYYIITDTNNLEFSQKISQEQCWQVVHAPAFSEIDSESLPKVYVFTNGLTGDGFFGFQSEVFSHTPENKDKYAGLTSHYFVSWNNPVDSHTLISENEILHAKQLRLITITESPIISNIHQIVWPDGQIPVKSDKAISNETPTIGGQVVDIDLDEMTVTFIAHRGWGPDGKTIYYIITGVTPSAPADAMGVPYTPPLANFFDSEFTGTIFHFIDGLAGPGPYGYQPGILDSVPAQENYSPIWNVKVIGWNATAPLILQTTGDIEAFEKASMIVIDVATPMGLSHVLNMPIIDPFQ